MAYSVFSYDSGGSGRAASGAVNPSRAASPDRKAPDSLDEERQAPDERKSPPRREDAVKAAERKASRRKPDPEAAAAAAARRAARNQSADESRPPLTPPEKRAEDIKKLEKLEAEALFTGPPTQGERAVAQIAHALIVRENAELRAHELEEVWKERERKDIARFIAAQAAAAYRELDGYAGYRPDALLH